MVGLSVNTNMYVYEHTMKVASLGIQQELTKTVKTWFWSSFLSDTVMHENAYVFYTEVELVPYKNLNG